MYSKLAIPHNNKVSFKSFTKNIINMYNEIHNNTKAKNTTLIPKNENNKKRCFDFCKIC